MQLIDIELAFEALKNSLSFKTILLGSGFVLFLLWSRSDILPALNHITLSIRTSEFQTLPTDVNAELGATIVPFGTTMSKLFLLTAIFLTINRMRGTLLEERYDWDGRVTRLKQKRKRKAQKLEGQIELIEQLSAKAALISSLSNDFEILADKVEHLKLELDKPSKPKPNIQPQKTNRNGELFNGKVNGSPKPPKVRPPERPEF